MAQTAFICFLYIFAWLFAMASFLLPYWISGEIDAGVRNVTVVKEVDSGLLWKRQTYYMKADSIPDSDDSFEDISGTNFHTEAVKIVLWLMVTGLTLLSFSLVSSVCVWCCSNKEKGGKGPAKLRIIIAVIMIFAGGFILSGPIIYYKHVTGDYGVKKEHIGLSCWLALTSAVITFLTGVLTFIKGCRSLRDDHL
ncbi:uncharacterized protein LOC123541195 [Mercenaria mercenaria]|uniref:uncharacterized protein LOC123541195 n=1 Tax=Mercenaria mercenaria TaxID=6596 RepID=UPI00234FA1F2|nr:uncharacterized protein LOC123541195 [Mercenaria mercenaria]